MSIDEKEQSQQRKLVVTDEAIYWLYPDGSHRSLDTASALFINNAIQAYETAKADQPDERTQAPTEGESVKELVKALEFYANPTNWHSPNSSSRGYHVTDQNGSMDRYHSKIGSFSHGCFLPDAGDRARLALARTKSSGQEPKAESP